MFSDKIDLERWTLPRRPNPKPRSPEATAIGEALAAERRRQRLTQRELARVLGMRQSQLAEIERHKNQGLNLDSVIRVARGLGGDIVAQFPEGP